MRPEERALIDEQIEYYSTRAPEYDSTARPEGDPFASEAEEIESALRAFEPRGRVLEIACGTGQYTGLLAEYATELTALDASAEMIEINRNKVRDDRISYVRANVFDWEPDAAYDVVIFGFWLSHVPPALLAKFWSIVRRALAPNGRVFFVDEALDPWRNEELLPGAPGPVAERSLMDGSRRRVVKVFWAADELQARLQAMGWRVEVRALGPFYWGAGAPTARWEFRT